MDSNLTQPGLVVVVVVVEHTMCCLPTAIFVAEVAKGASGELGDLTSVWSNVL